MTATQSVDHAALAIHLQHRQREPMRNHQRTYAGCPILTTEE